LQDTHGNCNFIAYIKPETCGDGFDRLAFGVRFAADRALVGECSAALARSLGGTPRLLQSTIQSIFTTEYFIHVPEF
jgi:hypothetical protein